MTERIREAVHQEPVWRDRSNFIIAAPLTGNADVKTEQLWARQLGDRRFEICCIPFFVYDLGLGDVVETDAKYLVTRVLDSAGHFTFRVWFGESFHPRDDVAAELQNLGALLEWSSLNLLGVDAADETIAKTVADYLHDHEQAKHLIYETGRT